MEFTRAVTGLLFVALILLGVVAMSFTPMSSRTVYMMVLPSMVVYGLVVLLVGVKHGEFRARGQ